MKGALIGEDDGMHVVVPIGIGDRLGSNVGVTL